MYKTVKVLNGQSLVDIALQEYGSISGLALILTDNSNTITDIANLAVGTELNIRTPIPPLDVTNKQVVKYFTENYNPATWQIE